MNLLKNISLILFFVTGASFTAFHHGWANYDQNKVLDYTGVVQESTYENPHATARIKDKNKIWVVVLAPTTRMDARGLNAEMLAKGATIRVVGYPHKKIKDEMRAERIFIDGKKFELR